MPYRKIVLFFLALSCVAETARGATLYWDANGTNTTAGAPSGPGSILLGTWGTSSFWSTDPTGGSATGAYIQGSDVVFTAGTTSEPFTVTLNGSQSVNSLTFQDGVTTVLGNAAGNNISIADGGTINTFASSSIIRAALNGGGSNGITFGGTGTTFLQSGFAGQNNGYTGPVRVSSGALIVGGTGGSTFAVDGVIKGNLTVDAGAVFRAEVGAGNVIDDSSVVTVNGFAMFSETVRAIEGSGLFGSSVILRPVEGTWDFSGRLFGNGFIYISTQAASGTNGTQILSGENYLTGTIALTAGTTAKLQLKHQRAMQFSPLVVNQSNSLVFGAGVGIFEIGHLSGSGNIALEDTGGNAVELNIRSDGRSDSYFGVLSGTGSVTLESGRLVLGSSNTYTGGTVVQNGTLTGASSSPGTPFGTGKIELHAGGVSLGSTLSSTNYSYTSVNATPSTTFTYAGGSGISLSSSPTGSLTYTLGHAAPSGPVLQRVNRGTLTIGARTDGSINPPPLALGVLGDKVKFVVNGMTSAANKRGIYDASVVGTTGTFASFVKYDETASNGFVLAEEGASSSYTTHSTDFTTTANEIADVTASAVITDGGNGNRMYAMRVAPGTFETIAHWTEITLNGTVTINGEAASSTNSGQAGLILGSLSRISGGALNFGASEGVIYVSREGARIVSTITGSAGVTKFGSGTLFLESANSFTGGLQINAGDVNFTDDNRLGAAGESVVLNGGILTPVIFNTQTMSIRGFEVGLGGGTISAQANGGVTGQTVNLAGPITGTGNLLFTGDSEASYLVNLANDGFTGDVDIRYIDVRLGTAEATLGSGDIRFTSGNGSLILEAAATVNNRLLFIGDGLGVQAVQVNATGATLAGDIIMQTNGSIWSQSAGSSVTTISGDISGYGPLRLGTASGSSSSNHTFILSGNNVHTSMEIGGITRIMSEQALGVENALLTFVNASDSATTGFGGTLQAGADNIELSMTRSLVVNTGVGNARIDTQGYTMTVASTISGNSHLTKVGSGRLVLTGNNTLTGYTTVAAGTLQVGAGGAQDLPAYGSVAGLGVVLNGSTAVLAGTGRILSDTTVQQGQIRAGDQSGSVDARGTLTFGGSVNLAGAGTSVRFGVGGATGNAGQWIVNGTDVSGVPGGAPSLVSGIAGDHDHLQFTGNGTLIWNPGAKLTVEFENGYSGGWAHVLNLMDWVTAMSTTGSYTVGGFIVGNGDEGADLELPDLTGTGLYWDTTLFKSHGVLVMVPEPGRAMLLMAGLAAFLFRRRR